MRSAVLIALALLVAGCRTSQEAARPGPASGPAKRYLVYEKHVGKGGVWIADADGSDPRLLVLEGHSPVVSPDGRSVAYVGGCGVEDRCKGTYVASTSGGKPRRVSSDTPMARQAAYIWSPDSQRIVVLRGQTSSNEELVSINVADGSTSTLAEGQFYGASFSPDAKQIAFAKATSATAISGEGAFDLFVAESDGSDPKQITHSGDSVDPAWGPKSIAFSRVVWDAGWGRNEIWRVNPDGSGREAITGPLLEMLRGTSGLDGLVPVGWSDDGHALLGGMLTSEGGTEPFAIDPGSGKARSLETKGEFIDTAAISHDGQSVLAATHPPMGADADSATVLIVPYGGGKPTVVARGAGSPSWNR